MIDHVGIEVSDLARSAAFYDAVFFALGVRRMHESEHAIAYGVTRADVLDRHARTASGARLRARRLQRRRARRGRQRLRRPGSPTAAATTARPGPRPRYGPLYYAAYLLDPDGLRVEIVANSR